ncbi:MAG: hypothetical protein GWM90_33335 [Gemmatimonadetes bacterium]|nr:hypothetical protein [Gemmatimonadota bacterium]NIQ60210.1 hypothetical protein [Gemmatimonadota bacterium]NIU80425.1 hypothetical protein [Gammaproteobacteria bacterium]NIX48762.1 hypothetical protein [Gemmatimonadota bacterium]NIY13218.1 hypothetical protein [Gemmatimonadota bacterium]
MTRTSALVALVLTVPLTAACDPGPEERADGTDRTGRDTLAADEAPDPSLDSGVISLAVDSLVDVGAYITDGQGRALYLFTADSAGTSACYDACTRAWPPLMAHNGGATAGAPAIQQSLIGTTERRDGGRQVTYGGHPLYLFARDGGPGHTAGQDVQGQGGEWYLVTPAGEPLESDAETEDTPGDPGEEPASGPDETG